MSGEDFFSALAAAWLLTCALLGIAHMVSPSRPLDDSAWIKRNARPK